MQLPWKTSIFFRKTKERRYDSYLLSFLAITQSHTKKTLKCLWSKKIIPAYLKGFSTVKKNGVFLFGISFFVLEIFTFLYYANEESDDVIDRSTKTVQHSIKNISGNIKAVIFKLGTRNVHHKRNKMTATILLPWQHPRFQSPSVKKTSIPVWHLFEWDRGSSSKQTWFPHCLNSPH